MLDPLAHLALHAIPHQAPHAKAIEGIAPASELVEAVPWWLIVEGLCLQCNTLHVDMNACATTISALWRLADLDFLG
jgi:hypothetical protein